MASLQERLSKLREDRVAREKARIEKLRELNFKKYGTSAQPNLKPASSNASIHKPIKLDATIKNTISNKVKHASNTIKSTLDSTKPHMQANSTIKRTISAPIPAKILPKKETAIPPKPAFVFSTKIDQTIKKPDIMVQPKKVNATTKIGVVSKNGNKTAENAVKIDKPNVNVRRSMHFGPVKSLPIKDMKAKVDSRKSMQPPKVTQSATKVNPNRQSVFERLYQPKIVPKKPVDEVKKLQTDPNYLKKVIKDAGMLFNKRHTVFEVKKTIQPVRRSISAVHFKRINKSEVNNCIHKWSSIGEKLDKVHLNELNEDEAVKEDKVICAVKSERKKVKFQSPAFNFNTPRPEELQSRLHNWLQKRGKSIDSYHHLQCFGIQHLSQKIKPMEVPLDFDDENKENVPLDSDSDNESYTEIMNNAETDVNNDEAKCKWRRASFVSDSVDFNDTQQSMLTESPNHVDELLLGALNDLTELLKEGFDWDQCARWLRAIRGQFPSAPDSAAYWECRAALEERRGDLPNSIQCWEEAIAKGTERSVVEANLDQLLDKFMQLKISPNSGKKQVDPKMIDVKNIFKSTIIRFAVQQAKLRNSNPTPTKYICTPVRRSGRLSTRDTRTPLHVCTSVKQAELLGHPVLFVPNNKLCGTP